MKLETITIPMRIGANTIAPIPCLTVGTVRRLLVKAARRRSLPRVAEGVTGRRAVAIISEALAGRQSGGPVSLFVANLATELAGLQPAPGAG